MFLSKGLATQARRCTEALRARVHWPSALAEVGSRVATTPWFEELPPPLVTRNIFDLGVVDLFQDGRLGIFTTNHNSRQSLLANRGGGVLDDVLEGLGLNQDPAFPTWECDVEGPALDGPGLYLYRRRNTIVIESIGDSLQPFSAELTFPSMIEIGDRSDVSLEVAEVDGASVKPTTVVRIRSQGRSRLEVTPELVGVPVGVRVGPGLPLSSVFIGPSMTNPSANSFVLRLRDRHGMAWADLDGTGRLDVFVARGGVKGRLEMFQGEIQDELFTNRGLRYEDVTAVAGIIKGVCRGRQAAWVDVGAGERLGLFVSCFWGAPHLYLRNDDGRYADVSEELGLSEVRGDSYAWVDVDGDGRLELLAATGNELSVYRRRQDGRYTRGQSVPLRSQGGPVNKLAVGDYRGDGLPHVFVPSPRGNTLLLNDGGTFRVVNPKRLGLPGRDGLTAHWVDYDNDGLVDLHVVPGGLFRQVPGGRFVHTGLLDHELPTPIIDVRASWFDLDNSGSRDVVVAVSSEIKVKGGAFAWCTKLFRNVGAVNHWLQVELVGPRWNRHGVGASVTVRLGDRSSTQWVGCNEGSHYSQGHYRLYFGLGQVPRTSEVEVRWPDGAVQALGRQVGDELVRIEYRPQSNSTSFEPAN